MADWHMHVYSGDYFFNRHMHLYSGGAEAYGTIFRGSDTWHMQSSSVSAGEGGGSRAHSLVKNLSCMYLYCRAL